MVTSDPAVRERLHGVVGERRAQHVAAPPLELLAVAAVDGRRGVQVHAERGHRQRRSGHGLGRRDRVRAGESELQAGRERDQGIAQLPLEQMNETLL